MKNNFLIYGAYGYTGRLIVDLAVKRGYKPVIAGRDATKTSALASQYTLPWVVFDVNDTTALTKALSGVKAVLHCAGPFSKTTPSMVAACLKTQTHYLDITGEIEVFEGLAGLDKSAQQAGIVLLPGVGFDVVPSDCLALFLKEQLPDATDLQLAFKSTLGLSRGTALTVLENAPKPGMIRQNGQLIPVPAAAETKQIQFQTISEPAVTIPWGDVSTAFYSTGIPNIRVFAAQSPGAIWLMKLMRYTGKVMANQWVKTWLSRQITNRIVGPSAEARQTGVCYLWGQVSNASGQRVQARLQTPEGYQLTSLTALLATERILNDAIKPGFYTPSMAFGADFILEIAGTKRVSGNELL